MRENGDHNIISAPLLFQAAFVSQILAFRYTCIVNYIQIGLTTENITFGSGGLCLLIEPYPGCWTQTNDVHGIGGIPHNFAELVECKPACIDDPNCVAIDWEPTNARQETCWILTSDAFTDTLEAGVITHYALNRLCLSQSSFYTGFYYVLQILASLCCLFL